MNDEAGQDSQMAKNSDVRLVAKRALARLLEPLAGFVLDSGLSTQELHVLFREAAVRSAAARQLEVAERVNISGIAAITGIPRGEISRILKAPAQTRLNANDGQQQSTNAILAAWHANPKFTDANGRPAELRLYGRGATFEALARKYGRGIPTRAVLDELIRSGAVEVLDTQTIRAMAPMAVERGMSARVVKAFGDRATELLSTMLSNMRQPEKLKFVANVADASIPCGSLPLFRKELAAKGADFLAELQESLSRNPSGRSARRRESGLARVSVTIYTHETLDKKNEKQPVAKKRRNFRRDG